MVVSDCGGRVCHRCAPRLVIVFTNRYGGELQPRPSPAHPGSGIVDRCSVGAHDVPQPAVVVEALTGGRAGLAVPGEVVEGVAAVSDLLLAAGPGRPPGAVGGKPGANPGPPPCAH